MRQGIESSTSLKQQRRPLPFLYCLYPSSMAMVGAVWLAYQLRSTYICELVLGKILEPTLQRIDVLGKKLVTLAVA